VAVVYQIRFSQDAVQVLWRSHEIARLPFGFQTPPTVHAVQPEADAAGVYNGDQLLAVNGQPFRGIVTLARAVGSSRPGEMLTVTVLRPHGRTEEARSVTILLSREWQRGLKRETWLLIFVLELLLPAMCLLLGIGVAAVRPTDRLAWLLLVMMLGFTQLLSPHWLAGWDSLVRYPAEIYHRIFRMAWPIGMILFGLYFPHRFAFERRHSWVKWTALTPLILVAITRGMFEAGIDENFAAVRWLSGSLIANDGIVPALGFCGGASFLGFLGWKFHRETNADSRRRLGLLFCGTAVSLTPLFLLGTAALATGKPIMEDFSAWVVVPSLLMLIIFPITLAYVIVVQRAIDVRVFVRQGVKYTLARRGLAVLRISASSAIVYGTVFEVQRHHAHQLWDAVAVAAGVALLVATRHLGDRSGNWVDRRFFRESYDAEHILGELSDTVRTMVETRPLLETVAERISESLHVPRLVVLLGNAGVFQPAYTIGYLAKCEVHFGESAAMVKHLRRSYKATRVYMDDPHSWVYTAPGMTEAERSLLVALGTELLLPMSVKDKLVGFISLGPKRSEEPYSGDDVRLLQSVAAQTGLALENSQLTEAIARETAHRERVNRELEIARDVQQRLFPQQLPPIAGLDYFATCRPAFRIGGDYYDFLALSEGKLGIAIGDVSGKGIGAALMMASLQASLRGQLLHGNGELTRLMASINSLLYEASEPERYATFFYAEYDARRWCLSYVNAGHNAPMLCRKREGNWEVQRLETGGTVVGLLPDMSFQQATLGLRSGDLLVAFTDGISEAMNAAGEQFGEQRLMKAIECCDGLTAAEITKRLLGEVDTFVASAPQHDDMTLVVMRFVEAE
jgi:sigma-B regulation protein RsbU (phosphoserine phosphatase)